MKSKVLIVDDNEDIRGQMRWGLAEDYEIIMAEDREGAMACFAEHSPQVVLLDLGLPPDPNTPEEGLRALSDILEQNSWAKVIVITGQGENENALRAIGEGAHDFLNKPVDMDRLKIIIDRACYILRIEHEYREMQQNLGSDGFEGMIGNSPLMQNLFNTIKRVAATEAPVLILGESGTGKEMAALAIHHRSRRQDGPFVPINCSAIPEALLESELFGHEKGAFTGAHAQKPGQIESATGGTLFLDEIGDLPTPVQAKILRFLQEQKIQRVGGTGWISVDARLVAATNRDLKQGMDEKWFREDLYFRLAVVVMIMPPLRDRGGDIPLLAAAFARDYVSESGAKITGLTQSAMQALEAHDWPGNVRELENLIRRAIIMAEGRKLKASDLLLSTTERAIVNTTLKDARETVEREMVRRALRRHKGTISRAATDLGISRPTLYELMDKLDIDKKWRS